MGTRPLYVKTPKGIDEVERRTHGLPSRRRKVLILIDGKRDEAALRNLVPDENLPATVMALLDEGFITPLVQASASSSPSKSHRPPANDGERFDMARNFMVNTIRAYIGVNGSGLIDKIDGCPDLDSLRHHFHAWRDAIQLASDGKKHIGELEMKLAAVLS